MTHLRSVSTGLICFLLMITTFSLSDALALPAPKASAGSCPAPLALGHASARDIAATPLYHETANPKSGSVAKRTNNEATPMEITKSQDVGFFRLQLLQGHTNDVDLQRSGLQISATAVKIHQVSTYWSQYTDTSGSAQLQETLTALSSMLQPNILYPQHAPMLPYPKGPWKQFTLPASVSGKTRLRVVVEPSADAHAARAQRTRLDLHFERRRRHDSQVQRRIPPPASRSRQHQCGQETSAEARGCGHRGVLELFYTGEGHGVGSLESERRKTF